MSGPQCNHSLPRREFLSTALAAAGVAASGVVTSFAADPGSKLESPLAPATVPPVLGHGDHRYECLHDWGALPNEIMYGLTHGVAVDARGFVHVLHTSRKESLSHDTVVVFDPAGKFVSSWGEQFFGTAHGFDLVLEGGQELLYVTDMARGLFKTTLEGKVLWHVDKPPFYKEGAGKGLKYTPTNIALASNGDVYLADGYGSWFIHRFDKDGNYKNTFGGPGDGTAAIDKPSPDATIHPHGLYIDPRGKEPLLVVAENDPKGRKPGRLHAFDLDGNHHSYLSTRVRSPRHFDRHGDLVVVPDLDAVVTLVDADNQVVAQLGDGFTTFEQVRALRTKPREQFKAGQFICPHDAAFGKDGSIFITEWVDVGRVTKLRKV